MAARSACPSTLPTLATYLTVDEEDENQDLPRSTSTGATANELVLHKQTQGVLQQALDLDDESGGFDPVGDSVVRGDGRVHHT